MTGFAYPEMLVELCRKIAEGFHRRNLAVPQIGIARHKRQRPFWSISANQNACGLLRARQETGIMQMEELPLVIHRLLLTHQARYHFQPFC